MIPVLLVFRTLACRLVPILVDLEDRTGLRIDIILILEALVEELHLVDQAAVLVVDLGLQVLCFLFTLSV